MKVRFLNLCKIFVMALTAILVGCGGGGGGGSATLPLTNATRSTVSQTLVPAVMEISSVSGLASLSRRVPSKSLSKTMTLARLAATMNPSRAGGLFYNSDLGLWYSMTTLSPTQKSLNFFLDDKGLLTDGSILIAMETPVGTYPASIHESGGILSQGVSLDLRMVVQTASFSSFTITGQVLGVGLSITNMNLTFASSALTGSYDATTKDTGVIHFTNVNFRSDGSGTADFHVGPYTGKVTIYGDGSGEATMTDSQGETKLVWQAEGNGTITYPDGSKEQVQV